MNLVLDASVALSWCFADETTPETDNILINIDEYDFYVPGLWSLEVGNILLLARKKQRISAAIMTESLSLLESLKIHTDTSTASRAFHQTLSLAQTHQLTTYDAAYLELAMRLGLPLATKDKALRKVCEQLHVPLVF